MNTWYLFDLGEYCQEGVIQCLYNLKNKIYNGIKSNILSPQAGFTKTSFHIKLDFTAH